MTNAHLAYFWLVHSTLCPKWFANSRGCSLRPSNGHWAASSERHIMLVSLRLLLLVLPVSEAYCVKCPSIDIDSIAPRAESGAVVYLLRCFNNLKELSRQHRFWHFLLRHSAIERYPVTITAASEENLLFPNLTPSEKETLIAFAKLWLFGLFT